MKFLKQMVWVTLLSLSNVLACGGGWMPTFVTEESYNFLDPSLVGIKENNPLYSVARGKVYGYWERVEYFNKKSKKLNIKEWERYLQGALDSKELFELFYGKEGTLLERYAKVASKINDRSFKSYLTFVAKQEPNVQADQEALAVTSEKLIAEGKKALLSKSNAFLKLRYLFLVMRLSHYSDDPWEALALYKKYYPSVQGVNSVVVEWIDAIRAGALQKTGSDVQSNLLYGEILKNNKSNAYLGYYDFKVENEKQWHNLMAKLKTPDEKALFHFLRALKWEGVPILEHRELAKIAPDSIWFNRLSYMIMQDFQATHYNYEKFIDKEDEYVKRNHKSYLEKKAFFLETLKSLKEPKFFSRYATLYLHILEQDKVENFTLEVASLKKLADNNQEKFVDMLSYIQGVRHIKKVEKGINKPLFLQLSKLLKEAPLSKRESILGYTAYYMQKLYPTNSAEKLFSGLCSEIKGSYGCWGVESNIDRLSAMEFEHYVEKKERSGYEKELFRIIMSSLAKNDVAKFLAILYTKNSDFKKAEHYLNQVPTLNREIAFNPFNVFLSGNNRTVKGKGYDQRKFIQTMLKIQETLKKNPTSAMDHFLYANGLYNSTWFGNFPMVASVDRSVTGFSDDEAREILKKFEPIEEEYQLAEKYATNREFKAKISYQLLKVGYHKFLLNQQLKGDLYGVGWFKPKDLVNSKEFTHSIAEYKSNYSKTKYGKEVIKKCATFKYFK